MQNTVGWVIFISALGSMAGLMSVDIAKLQGWDEALKPAFVASFLGHFAVVIAAFAGGKIINDPRDKDMRTRTEDKVSEAKVAELNKKDI